MKKVFFVAMAAVALMTIACGGNKQQKEGDAEGEQTEQTKKEVAWQTYTNDNFGYSVEVPGDMDKRETLTEDSGTIFSYDGPEGVTFNRIDIGGGEQFFGEEYTPEKVKEDFAYWTDGKELTSKECGDNYFTYSMLGGEYCDEIVYHIYKGTHYVVVNICYDKEHEAQLGGEVAQRVFKSIKIK